MGDIEAPGYVLIGKVFFFGQPVNALLLQG